MRTDAHNGDEEQECEEDSGREKDQNFLKPIDRKQAPVD
jgi:hypothetical protein